MSNMQNLAVTAAIAAAATNTSLADNNALSKTNGPAINGVPTELRAAPASELLNNTNGPAAKMSEAEYEKILQNLGKHNLQIAPQLRQSIESAFQSVRDYSTNGVPSRPALPDRMKDVHMLEKYIEANRNTPGFKEAFWAIAREQDVRKAVFRGENVTIYADKLQFDLVQLTIADKPELVKSILPEGGMPHYYSNQLGKIAMDKLK